MTWKTTAMERNPSRPRRAMVEILEKERMSLGRDWEENRLLRSVGDRWTLGIMNAV
jgi:hypothetical protein